MSLIAIGVVALTGCVWPSVDVDDRGAGGGLVGRLVREHWMGAPERALPPRLADALYGDSSRMRAVAPTELEALGFACLPHAAGTEEPPTTCHYAGQVLRRLHGLPAGSPARITARIGIAITADLSTRPVTFTVRATEIERPSE